MVRKEFMEDHSSSAQISLKYIQRLICSAAWELRREYWINQVLWTMQHCK